MEWFTLRDAVLVITLISGIGALWTRITLAQRKEAVRRNNIEHAISDLRGRLDRGDSKFAEHRETDSKIEARLGRLETGQAEIKATLDYILRAVNGK